MAARFALVLALAMLAVQSCGGPEDQSVGAPASIFVTPASVLLTAPRETVQLSVEVRDRDQNPLDVPVSFSSSHADQASVDSTGLVTAETSVGSAQIFVEVGGIEATPVAVLVATPAMDAIIVTDDQIVSEPELLNPNETLDVGSEYSIVLDGVDPEPGRVILGAGEIPLAGRVVSASAVPSGTEVIVEARPVAELFQELSIDEVYELTQPELEADQIDETSGALRYRVDQLEVRKGENGDFEFKVGPFECKAAVQPQLTGRFLELKVSQSLNFGFVVDIRGSRLRRLLVRLRGAVSGTVTGGISLTAGLQGEIGCKWIIQTYRIPVPKPVAVLFGPVIPVGLGMKLGGMLQVAQLEYTMEGKSEATLDLGFDYQNGLFVETFGEFDATADHEIKQMIPENLLDGLRLIGGLSANGFAELAISGVIGRALAESFDAGSSFGLLDASFGPALEANLATEEAQVNDNEYASGFTLRLKGSAGLAGDLGGIFKLFDSKVVNLQLLDVKATTNIELARSPAGTFSADQTAVDQGDTVNFTVTFDPVSVSFPIFGYNIDSVQVYRETGSGLVVFDEQAASEGQEVFEFSWTTSEMDLGEHRFAAFVSTPALPRLPLEISKDASVMITVGDVLPTEVVEAYVDSGLNGGVRKVSLEVQGQDVAIVFDRWHTSPAQGALWLVRSSDGGTTFGDPSLVARSYVNSPRLAMGPDGDLQVVHSVGDLSIFADSPATIVARTAPSGGNFGPAVTLSTPGATAVGQDDVAVAPDGTVYAVWTESGTDPEASDRHSTYLVRLRTSADDGSSYASPVTVYEQPAHAALSEPRIAVDPSGLLHVAWLEDVCSMTNGAGVFADCPHLLYSSSADGVSFTAPIVVGQYLFARGGAYDMVAHAAQTASFVYPRDNTEAETTLPYTRVVDGNVTVSSSVTTTSNGFDSLGFPALTIDGAGIVHVAWAAQQDFLHLAVAKSDTAGAAFGLGSALALSNDPQGAQWPSLTSDGASAYGAWVEFRSIAPRIALLFQRLP